LLKEIIFIFDNLKKVPVHRTGVFHYKKALHVHVCIVACGSLI